MKKAVPVIFAVGLIFLIVLGVFGYQAIQRYIPTTEPADLSELYQAEGNQIAVFYNYELQDIQGIFENGQTYLPLSWVNETINKRFYWDSTEQLLVYTPGAGCLRGCLHKGIQRRTAYPCQKR